jgi:hypothetical protein
VGRILFALAFRLLAPVEAPMASTISIRLTPDKIGHRFRDGSVEPSLGPRDAPRPTTHGRKPTLAPEPSSRSTERPVDILLYLVSVGLVAAAIIGIFGVGLVRLASPASEALTDLDRNRARVYGSTLETGREANLASQEAAMPYLAAVAVLPGLPPSQRSPADEAVPPARSETVQEFTQAGRNSEPPAKPALVPEQGSSSAAPPDAPALLANPPSLAAESAVLPAGAKARLARDGHSARTRTALHHSRLRSTHTTPTLTPPQSTFAQTLTPPKTSSFGEMVTRLAGQTKPIGKTLTPPQPEQPDPNRDKMPDH